MWLVSVIDHFFPQVLPLSHKKKERYCYYVAFTLDVSKHGLSLIFGELFYMFKQEASDTYEKTGRVMSN